MRPHAQSEIFVVVWARPRLPEGGLVADPPLGVPALGTALGHTLYLSPACNRVLLATGQNHNF